MKTTSALEGVNLLDLAPRRAAEWTESGGKVVVERPPPSGRGLRRLWEAFTYHLSTRRIRLDERGSFAWRALDGSASVGQVAEAMRREFGAEVEPAEERLGHLVRSLHREGLVVYPGIDDAPPPDVLG